MPNMFAHNMLTGQVIKVEVSSESPPDKDSDCRLALSQMGYREEDLKDFIICEEQLDGWPEDSSHPETVLVKADAHTTPSGILLPHIPEPQSPTQTPPPFSEIAFQSANPPPLISLSASGGGVTHIKIGNGQSGSTFANIAPPIRLKYSVQWARKAVVVAPGGPLTYSKSVSYTKGMSTTNSRSFSASLGVSYGGLSASVSRTVGYSVTISNSTTVTDSYEFVSREDATTVMVIWHLVSTFQYVDTALNPISGVQHGVYEGRHFTVDFPGPFINDTNNIAVSLSHFP